MKSLEPPPQLLPSIGQYLRRFVLRRRRVMLVRASSLSVLIALLWMLAWAVADRFLALPMSIRACLLGLLALVMGLVLFQPLRAYLRRSADWRAAAEQLEDSDPRFNEMLATIVSHSLGGALHEEASAELVERIVAAIESRISVRDSRRSVPLAPAIAPTLAAACGLVIVLGLCAWPWLNLPQLLARQMRPFAAIPPVTTTQMIAAPGDIEVTQGTPLTISAKASPLLGSTVLLRTTTDGQNWTNLGMSPSPDGWFTFHLPSVMRDMQYEILAGDASAGPFKARVRRKPLVREFQIKLNYPQYVHKPPLKISSTDGAIEAPAGTVADITIIASEPLSDAKLILDGEELQTMPIENPFARQAQIQITKDQHWGVELMSDRNVPGASASGMSIHALPDLPPIVRLSFPQGTVLLRPRDIVEIPYQAADDFAIASINARIQVDSNPPRTVPLNRGSDARRCDDLLSIDLAQCNVEIGERVDISLVAGDSAGHVTTSQSCRVVIAPQAIEFLDRRRLDDLRESAQIAARICGDLDPGDELASRRSKVAARMNSASESAALLVRALLRAAAGVNDPALANRLAVIADQSQIQASQLESINSQAGTKSSTELMSQARSLVEPATQILNLIAPLRDASLARIVRLQRENLAAIGTLDDPVVTQLRSEIDSALADLHVGAGSDIDARLAAIVDSSSAINASAKPVDFEYFISQWARSTRPQAEWLSERLGTAAMIEAVRKDSDLVWARDLQMTSRAVRTIDALLPAAGVGGPSPDMRSTLAESFSDLVAARSLRQRNVAGSPSTIPSGEDARLRVSAADARTRIRNLGGKTELGAAQSASGTESNQLAAMEANALSSESRYEQAAALDAALYRDVPMVRQRVEADLERVRQLDALSGRQRNLQLGVVTPSLASTRQSEISTQIQNVIDAGRTPLTDADSRERGLTAVRRIQEELADLPQRLSRIDRVIERQLASVPRAAGPDEPPFEQAVSPPVETLEQSWRQARTERVADLVGDLRAFAPETSDAVGRIETQMMPALQRLSDRVSHQDPAGAARALADLRRAVVIVQEALQSARQTLLDRDPLVAAKWFAREAADSLDRPSTQPANAAADQTQALASLRRAWDQAVHQLADARLGGSAGMATILRSYASDSVAGMPGIEWGSQRSLRDVPAAGASGLADPPGYEDPIRAYFKAINAAKLRER